MSDKSRSDAVIAEQLDQLEPKPYDRIVRARELRALIAEHSISLHDVWLMGIFLAEGFSGMIKFTNVRVVLHVKQEPRAKRAAKR